MTFRRRWGMAALAAVLTVGLVGCDEGSEPEPEPPTPSEKGALEPDGEGATLPPGLLECDSERYSDDGTLLLAELDLTAATWDTPSGFAEEDGYYEANPPADQISFWVAGPQPPVPPSVIGVAVHGGVDWSGIADPCARIPADAVTDWLEEYHEGSDAVEMLTDVQAAQMGAQEAVSQVRRFSDRTSRATWLFSQEHVLVVYCQWGNDGDEEQLINEACDELLASVRVE